MSNPVHPRKRQRQPMPIRLEKRGRRSLLANSAEIRDGIYEAAAFYLHALSLRLDVLDARMEVLKEASL